MDGTHPKFNATKPRGGLGRRLVYGGRSGPRLLVQAQVGFELGDAAKKMLFDGTYRRALGDIPALPEVLEGGLKLCERVCGA